MNDRVAVILLNHGAASTVEGLPSFLENIFKDRGIIKLPGGPAVQDRFARFISRVRTPRVRELYRYMGGGSPLLSYMTAQARSLEYALSSLTEMPGFDEQSQPGKPADFKVFIALRYCEPTIQDVIDDIMSTGYETIVAFPQYPQYSKTTVGSVQAALDTALERHSRKAGTNVITIPPFGSDPRYVTLMSERVTTAAAAFAASTHGPTAQPALVFTAHSVPTKFIDEGDPYALQCAEQAKLIADAAGFDAHFLGYQSKSGPVSWLGPETDQLVEDLITSGRNDLIVVPLSFAQDHLETDVELDVQLAATVAANGGRAFRTRPVNNDARFTALCADLVATAIT